MLRVLLCTAVALALLVASSAAPETHARSEAPPASAAGRGRRVSAWQRQRRNEFKLSQNLDDAHNASISDDEESGSGGTSDEADHESSASASANASTEERVEFANGTSTDAMGNVNSVKSSSNPSGLLSPVNNASSPANSQTPTPLLPVAGNAPRANATDSAVVSSGTSTTTSPSPSSSSPPFEAVGAVWPKKKESVAELFRKLKSKLEREVTEFLENNQLLVVCSVFALIFILFLIPGLVFYCCCRACRRRQRTHQQLERRTSFTSQMLLGPGAIGRQSALARPSIGRASAAHVTRTRTQSRSSVRAGAGAAGVRRKRSGESRLESEFARAEREGAELVPLGFASP